MPGMSDSCHLLMPVKVCDLSRKIEIFSMCSVYGTIYCEPHRRGKFCFPLRMVSQM